ncbi:unnamed protein product [Clavelina lepadiformis]|uniref:Uncharacterized protein n=2 Tax=Clavelina lepadiformis TaxID=159417 RepID=A0ABP0FGH7_CLALP
MTTCRSDSYVYSFTTLVGSICIFIFLLKLLIALRKFFLREGFDLGKRYGTGTWALITAPTSATGNGFAVELAKQGFNIILLGRDIEKLHKMRDLLILRHNTKVRTLVMDFRGASDISFFAEVLRQAEDLDVSIIVHAVGMAALSKKFHLQSAERNRQCLIVNMFAPVLLSHHLIPRLQLRYHKSAIINISGENAHQPIPGMAISSGAKSFIRQFSVAASYEYEDKIDIMSVQPLAVKKAKLNDSTPESVFVIESCEFAKSCLKQLGHERSTSGHWIHQLQSWAYSLIPEELKLRFWFKVLLPQHLRASSSGISDKSKPSNGSSSIDKNADLSQKLK